MPIFNPFRIISQYDYVCSPTLGLGVDFTSVATACAALTTGKRLFVSYGTYNETSSVLIPSNVEIVFESRNGGVVIDFGGGAYSLTGAAHTAKDSDCGSASGVIAGSGTTFAWSTGHTNAEASINANPTAYSVCYGNALYPIQSINTGTHTITLASAIKGPVSASAQPFFVLPNDRITNVVMSGKLTLQNTTAIRTAGFFEFENFDFSGLDITCIGAGIGAGGLVGGARGGNLGIWRLENQTCAQNYAFVIGSPVLNASVKLIANNVIFSAGSATDVVANYIGAASTDLINRGLNLDIQMSNLTSSGSQTNITIQGFWIYASAQQGSVKGSIYGTWTKGTGSSYSLRTRTGFNYAGLQYDSSSAATG